MSNEKPTGFESLTPTELYRSAIEDFALPVDEADKRKKNVLLAAFVEGGVSWSDYVAQHPEVAPEPEPQAVVTTADLNSAPAEPVVETVVTQPNIRVQEEISATNDKYLVKMVRDNALFEVRGQRFTAEHPYALVNSAMADYLLTKEDGFRLATPSELREFYG